MKKIVFTGGGSGGHVVPALTLIRELEGFKEFEIHYVGGYNSIERDLVADYKLTYHPIFTGKLRRYISLENLKDVFKIVLGFIQSLFLLFKFLRDEVLVFSTGGFVSVPVVLAAKVLGHKVYIHEQTSRVGLANKICSKFSDKVFISFQESFKFFEKSKTVFSGYPVRAECFTSNPSELVIQDINILKSNKPILFVTGGGNGAKLINDLIKRNLSLLTRDYLVVHQVGKTFINEFQVLKSENYFPLAFIGKEMIDLLKVSKVTVSRAGAGTVCELIAIGKKSIFIPLKIAQKNEQYHNAMEAHHKLSSIVIEEDNLNDETFLKALSEFQGENARKSIGIQDGTHVLLSEVKKFFKIL